MVHQRRLRFLLTSRMMSLITVVSVLLASETYRGDLTATHTREGQPVSD
jgi:hypothetical protein